jgi:two-component system, NtrC family, response regulator
MDTSKPKLLIIEDDEGLRTQMKWALAQDYGVFVAADRATALDILKKEEPSLVTMDLGLPPDPDGVTEGFQTLAQFLEANPSIKVVVITGRQEKEHALRAVAQGAYDFFCKPVEIQDLKVVLGRALHLYQLEQENKNLRAGRGDESFQGLLGASPQMEEVFAKIRKVATTDAPVLLVGESGTGKELAARAIHNASPRKGGPFVAINSGAIPETLLESELFGHEKGAFTGAHMQRKGRIEIASGGTLFLDEIGDLSLHLQVKLLRFLQERQIERVGGRELIFVDTRVIAATNRDLTQALSEGRFREDLYYRLGVVVVALPPLRERDGDVMLLATALLQRFISEFKKKIFGFSQQAVRAMEAHGWPGNVRELENRIKRAVIMAEGRKITPQDMELASKYSNFDGLGLKEAREAMEKELVRRALARSKGNLSLAAAELGVSRPTLYDLMGKLGLVKE